MRKSLFFVLMLPAACALGAQNQKAPARRAEPLDEGGIWPTRKMMDLMLARWGEMVSEHYELDEKQSTELTSKIKSRWTTFAKENQKTLEPLLTDFIEMRLQMEPPTKEQVAEWSKRAGGAFDLLEKEINQGAEEMRGILRDDQRAKFDGEMMGFQTGMQFARTQLNRWQQGEFQEREFWDPPLAVRRERREAEQARAKAEEAKAKSAAADASGKMPGASMADGPPDQIASEVDAWTQHVEDFIKKYELDEAQKKSAYSILKELKDRALAHRDANKPEIDKLERRIALGTGTPEELKQVEEQLVKLYGPIDAMFEELQRRIEPIPTAKQKAAARKREKAKESEAKPTDPEKKEVEGKGENWPPESSGEKGVPGSGDERKNPGDAKQDGKPDAKPDTKQDRPGSDDDAADAGPLSAR
ncbi:MAG: hypothetical protein IT449_03700 [Phycisphaerales bacterium]|nr:hypothetical protein [Phycisphaerales bacterium]